MSLTIITVFPAGATTKVRLKYRMGPEVGPEIDDRSLKNPVTVNVIKLELKKNWKLKIVISLRSFIRILGN